MRRLGWTILLAIAAVLAVPGTALATAPPTILTAGFDAQDQLYATWSLAPGTRYRQVEFASLPMRDAELPYYFADGQFAGYNSCRASGCGGKTSFTADYPVTRDRRYFAKVTAIAGQERATSAIWVIDETKPVVPGEAKVGEGDGNNPVAGTPFDIASFVPPGVVPGASITLLPAPKTIAGLLRRGVRVRATSSVAFVLTASLIDHGGQGADIGVSSLGVATGGTRTVVARVDDAAVRKALRHRLRARLRLDVVVVLPDDTLKRARRSFTVRR
jgi:hypothetical protein